MKEQQTRNILIALELLNFLLDNPDLRFIQALWVLGIVDGTDRFYETSKETLKEVQSRLTKMKGDLDVKVRKASEEVEKAT